MINKLMRVLLVVVSLACMSAFGMAQTFTQDIPYDVRARIPDQNGFEVTISRVQGSNFVPQTSVDFGTLIYNNTLGIFLANYYYAVDVGVTANLANWSIKHAITPIVNIASNETLDNNINVSFVQQTSTNQGTHLAKVTYGNSNNQIFTKNQLVPGWLRIYYGIATGDTNSNAPGAVPITINKPAGTYRGRVTLTLFETP